MSPDKTRGKSGSTASIQGKTSAQSAPDGANAAVADAIKSIADLIAKDPSKASAITEALKKIAESAPSTKSNGKKSPKRAICLAGGGPAAGLHIGVLRGLQEDCKLDFRDADCVWALSCIGAWVGIVYNQADTGKELDQTYRFFHDVFRDDKSFKSFPTNTIFAPDWAGNAEAMQNFLFEPQNYRNAFLPRKIMESFIHTLSILGDRENWKNFSEGDFNRWTLNHVLAVNPAMRFLTALMYKSDVDGRAKLHYPESTFLTDIKFEELRKPDKPYIFHNAWNLSRQHLDLFSNRDPATNNYHRITPASLCACSALPFIEQTVQIGKDTYCEGALIDTVNFSRLLEDHPDLDEIWISRIVDADQILAPKNLHDSLANLCQMFAATVGEDDVRLFKYHVKEDNEKAEENEKAGRKGKEKKWTGTIIEIPVERDINFEWSHTNLEHGIDEGRKAAKEAFTRYSELMGRGKDKDKLEILGADDRETRTERRRDRLIKAGRARH